MSPLAAWVMLMESRKMCLVCLREHKMGTCLSSEGKKGTWRDWNGELALNKWPKHEKIDWQNINTSSSEKLDITRKESYPVPFETHPRKKKPTKPNTHCQSLIPFRANQAPVIWITFFPVVGYWCNGYIVKCPSTGRNKSQFSIAPVSIPDFLFFLMLFTFYNRGSDKG